MIAALVFALGFSWWQATEKNSQPIISATDPEYLGCTVWKDHKWTAPTARSARTPVLESAKGFRAYAEVRVFVNHRSCVNKTTIYVASGAGAFKAVYTKSPSASDGNGIRLIGWSPSGDKLLAEVTLWHYETDTGYAHLALVYDASKASAREVPALDQALDHYFGTDCEFELALQGWRTNEQILVKIKRTPDDDSYEQHFCVKEPVMLLFDLRNQTVQATAKKLVKPNSPRSH